MKRRLCSRCADDTGAVLVFALIIITVVAVVTGALMLQGGTNLLATSTLRDVADRNYVADAAAKIAIDDLVEGYTSSTTHGPDVTMPSGWSGKWVFDNDADGTGCFGTTDLVTGITSAELKKLTDGTVGGTTAKSARVECAPVAGTGILASGPGDRVTWGVNTPVRALTLLGSGATGDGLLLKPQGSGNNNRFVVSGGIAVKAGIEVDNGSLYSKDYTWAVTPPGCTYSGPGRIDPAPDCAHAASAITNPAYTPGIPDPSSLTYQSGPTTVVGSGSAATCTFSPGYYDDAIALSGWTDSGTCGTSVFIPGTYYFDFHNNTGDPTYSAQAVSGPGADSWKINDTLIGGATTGASTWPGQCVDPLVSGAANGVQFIFGGDSHIFLGASAQVELCGTASTSSVPLTLLGLDGAAYGPASLAAPANATASTVQTTGSSGGAWSPTTVPASLGATWSSGASVSSVGILTLSNFSSAVPAGSILTGAQLKVTHSETVSSGTVATPTFQVTSGSATQTFAPSSPRTSLTPDSFSASGSLLKALQKAVHDGTLGSTATPTKVTLQETGANTTFSVQSVSLILTYYPPTFRAQTATGYGASNCVADGSCNLIDTGVNWGGRFIVDGTTYGPNGVVAIDPGNGLGTVAFRDGLIARGLNMKGQPQYNFADPVVSLPAQGPGSDSTVVDLKVYVCSGATCASPAGTLALTSRVRLTDQRDSVTGVVTINPRQRKVEVLSWAAER